MADLSINFAGIKSPNPFWLASGPPSNTGSQVKKAFEQGWGGAVWKTIGTPVVNVSSRYGSFNYRKETLVGMTNIELISDRDYVGNLKEMEDVKKHFPDRTLIASLMAQSHEDWHRVVRDAENAGADGLELNFGCPHGLCERGMGSAVGQNPATVELLTRWVMEKATVPVIVKLTPNISDITEPARAARNGGAHAISLINTIQSIAGVDIDTFVPFPAVEYLGTNGGYSGPAIKPIALNMVRNCAQAPDISLPISGIGGIETWKDALEFILLGCSSVQVCTAVMHYGFGIIEKMISGLSRYMDEKGFQSIDELVGKALPHVTAWEDLNLRYRVVASIDTERCTGCNMCYTACNDGAYQAIKQSEVGSAIVPVIREERCVGCNLCSLVCPVDNCITMMRVDQGNMFESWKQRSQKVNL